jgi:hypothetical protein
VAGDHQGAKPALVNHVGCFHAQNAVSIHFQTSEKHWIVSFFFCLLASLVAGNECGDCHWRIVLWRRPAGKEEINIDQQLVLYHAIGGKKLGEGGRKAITQYLNQISAKLAADDRYRISRGEYVRLTE